MQCTKNKCLCYTRFHKCPCMRVSVTEDQVIVSFLKLPLLSTHRALLLYLLWVQPLEDAVHVEAVGALAPDQWAVISRNLAWKIKRRDMLDRMHDDYGHNATTVTQAHLQLPGFAIHLISLMTCVIKIAYYVGAIKSAHFSRVTYSLDSIH